MGIETKQCCIPNVELRDRALLSEAQASALESTFKMLANGTRLRMLHALVQQGELCVTDLAEALGMKAQAISNQLQRLADRGIVASRREGLQIHYRIVDPCTVELLDRGWCLTGCAATRVSGRGEMERVAP
ncbi:MAG: metalloregulator ArsR/SmtB family transcription factor [Nitrospiraceae bacterium]|nr:metalloregulator ArsR/SmtB family transcription factor [Nitrospiraceae bacterium]